jgi:hypothetical protein
MAASAPAHLFRFQAIDFITRGDGGTRIRVRIRSAVIQRLRHQRRGLRTRGKSRGTCDNAQCDLQEIPAFQ